MEKNYSHNATKVNEEVQNLLGDKNQFSQIVMIAQGDFFLKFSLLKGSDREKYYCEISLTRKFINNYKRLKAQILRSLKHENNLCYC